MGEKVVCKCDFCNKETNDKYDDDWYEISNFREYLTQTPADKRIKLIMCMMCHMNFKLLVKEGFETAKLKGELSVLSAKYNNLYNIVYDFIVKTEKVMLI